MNCGKALVVLVILALLVGCGRTSEKPVVAWERLAVELTTLSEDMADLLATVNSETTADSAAQVIAIEFLPRIDELEAEAMKLKQSMSSDELEKARAKVDSNQDLEQRADRAFDRFEYQWERIAQSPHWRSAATDNTLWELENRLRHLLEALEW